MAEIDFTKLTIPQSYNQLVSMILRPIAWVGTRSRDTGKDNLAPFSFFNLISQTDLMFSVVTPQTEKPKDTLVNLQPDTDGKYGQFSLNIVSRDLAEKANQSSATYPHGVSEFEMTGLTPAECTMINAPYVFESPISLECEVFNIIPVNGGQEYGSSNLVLAKVLFAHVRGDIIDGNGVIQTDYIDQVLRAGGTEYSHPQKGETFSIPRPTTT